MNITGRVGMRFGEFYSEVRDTQLSVCWAHMTDLKESHHQIIAACSDLKA